MNLKDGLDNFKGYSYFSKDRREVFIYIAKIYLMMGEIVDKFCNERGLNQTKLNALFILSQNQEGILLSELGKQLFLSKSGITKLVDNMEKEDLIQRCNHPEDRRSTLAKITEKGINLSYEILPKVELIFDLADKSFTKGEKDIAVKLLRKYFDTMQDLMEDI